MSFAFLKARLVIANREYLKLQSERYRIQNKLLHTDARLLQMRSEWKVALSMLQSWNYCLEMVLSGNYVTDSNKNDWYSSLRIHRHVSVRFYAFRAACYNIAKSCFDIYSRVTPIDVKPEIYLRNVYKKCKTNQIFHCELQICAFGNRERGIGVDVHSECKMKKEKNEIHR